MEAATEPLVSLAPPPPEQMHPTVRALYGHWRSIHPEAGLPGRQHFDPVDVPRLLPNIWLMDVESEPIRFRFRLIGSALIDAGPQVRVGALLDECIPDPDARAQVASLLVWAKTTRSPAWRKGAPIIDHRRYVISAEALILPLATDGVLVDRLLCVTAYHRQTE